MSYDDTVNGVAQAFFAAASGQTGKSNSGGMLEAAKAGRIGRSGGEAQEETDAARNVTLIKEKGFRAFLEEMQARKLAELREKTLQSLGLNEEDLEEMDADQRAAIERMIADKIRDRLAARTEIETKADGGADASDEVTAQALAARSGFGAGFAVLQALENADAAGRVPGVKDEA
jgi:hypothetical protein